MKATFDVEKMNQGGGRGHWTYAKFANLRKSRKANSCVKPIQNEVMKLGFDRRLWVGWYRLRWWRHEWLDQGSHFTPKLFECDDEVWWIEECMFFDFQEHRVEQSRRLLKIAKTLWSLSIPVFTAPSQNGVEVVRLNRWGLDDSRHGKPGK